MFRPRLERRLAESCRNQPCRVYQRLFVTPSSKSYAQATPPSGRPASRKPTATSSTSRASTASSSPSASAGGSSPALRTAEARESALRAARMRRLAQQQDREVEAAKKAQEKKEYQKKYNTAARKWVSAIIALPIFLVTSYYLFDRLALGHQPKALPKLGDAKETEA